MAITKVAQFNSAPTVVADYEAQNAHIMAFINQVNSQAFILTNPTGTTEPAVALGTYINNGGTLYVVATADEVISGTPADGNVYIKLAVSGDDLLASYITDISTYAWNNQYGNMTSGTDIVLPYLLVKDGTSWTKYRMDIRNPAKIVTTSINTGHGDNQVYAMNQDVKTTDAVTFSTVNTGQGANNLYEMDQDVKTTDDVTFNGADFTGTIRPKTDPTLGSQSVAGFGLYTPPRGLYNSSWYIDHRGGQSSTWGGGDGPYAGNTDTRTYNGTEISRTWYFARF